MTPIGTDRRQRMTEAGWIIRESIGRAMAEYELTHAELTAILAQEITGWSKPQLAQEWGEE